MGMGMGVQFGGPSMAPPMMAPTMMSTGAISLYPKFQETFKRIIEAKKHVGQQFLAVKGAFEALEMEQGLVAGKSLKMFLQYFEQLLALRKQKRATDLERFEQIFKQKGYKKFTNKTVFDEISRVIF